MATRIACKERNANRFVTFFANIMNVTVESELREGGSVRPLGGMLYRARITTRDSYCANIFELETIRDNQ